MSGPGPPQPPVSHPLTQAAIDRYAELSGDFNPIHVDPAYSAETEFGGTIAHGPLVLGVFFDALLGWLGTDSLPAGIRIEARFRHPTPSGSNVICELTYLALEGEVAELRATCSPGDGVAAVTVAATIPAAAGSPSRAALFPGS